MCGAQESWLRRVFDCVPFWLCLGILHLFSGKVSVTFVHCIPKPPIADRAWDPNNGLNTRVESHQELKSLFFVCYETSPRSHKLYANCRMAFELIKFTVNIQQLQANRSEYVCFSNSFTCEWIEHRRIPSIF